MTTIETVTVYRLAERLRHTQINIHNQTDRQRVRCKETDT